METKKKENGSTFLEKVDHFFKISERGSSFRNEIIGGLVTFLAMAYILAVNPDILGKAGMPVGGVFLATAIIAGIATIAMGLYAKIPFGLAPGMGTNAFFAYTIVGPNGLGYTWQEALAAGIVAGVLFLLLSVTPARKMIIEAIPANLRLAIGAGIGFFIAFIGLKEAGIIVRNEGTLVGLTNFKDPIALLALFGIVLALILHT
ncbi:MAG: NCS2 family permease, partial [Acholeplasmataceae bacterium]|nr:NCS2 family permease [Acholeplasmataceae bacterium]